MNILSGFKICQRQFCAVSNLADELSLNEIGQILFVKVDAVLAHLAIHVLNHFLG